MGLYYPLCHGTYMERCIYNYVIYIYLWFDWVALLAFNQNNICLAPFTLAVMYSFLSLHLLFLSTFLLCLFFPLFAAIRKSVLSSILLFHIHHNFRWNTRSEWKQMKNDRILYLFLATTVQIEWFHSCAFSFIQINYCETAKSP